jgi:hypothetical protein
MLSRSGRTHAVLGGALAAARVIAGAAALAAVTAAASCDGVLLIRVGQPAGLIGVWCTRVQPVSPTGTWQRTLVVRRDDRVERREVSYGLYPGDAPSKISASSTLYGSLGATGTKYVIHPDSLVSEDTFGGTFRRTVQRDFSGWRRDSVTYSIRGDRLELGYYTYPADAPVFTREVMYRVP